MSEDTAVALRAVTKVYGGGRDAVAALDRVDLEVGTGELVCVVAPRAAASPPC